jgi:hypothetical protein
LQQRVAVSGQDAHVLARRRLLDDRAKDFERRLVFPREIQCGAELTDQSDVLRCDLQRRFQFSNRVRVTAIGGGDRRARFTTLTRVRKLVEPIECLFRQLGAARARQ